jgi:hypothetical protein
MLAKSLYIAATIVLLTGTWLLAFGLRIKDGGKASRKTRATGGQAGAGRVRQHAALFWVGLGLITAGALLGLAALLLG